jgi:hypothetical protein
VKVSGNEFVKFKFWSRGKHFGPHYSTLPAEVKDDEKFWLSLFLTWFENSEKHHKISNRGHFGVLDNPDTAEQNVAQTRKKDIHVLMGSHKKMYNFFSSPSIP